MKTKLKAMLDQYRSGQRGPIGYHELADLIVDQQCEEQDATGVISTTAGQVYLDAVDAAAAHAVKQDALYPGYATFKAAAPQVVADERAYTAEQARDQFMDQVRHLVGHWEGESRAPTAKEKLEGLAFSIMNIFDGTSGLPAFDIVCAPHPDDKQYHIDEGSKYFVPGMVINECRLHELLFSGRASAPVPTYRNDPTVQGMADCMDMVRQELIEAGVIGAGVAPMFIANAVVAKLAAPVQAQEPIYQARSPEETDWRDIDSVTYDRASANGFEVRTVYRAPVHPVAVPDGLSNKVRTFIDSVIEIGFEGDDVDGAAILQWAEDAGLIEARTMTEPCSEGQNCRCATDNDFPLTCYQKTYRRAAPAAQGDAMQAVLRFSPTQEQFKEWCDRYGMQENVSHEAFYDAASLYLLDIAAKAAS